MTTTDIRPPPAITALVDRLHQNRLNSTNPITRARALAEDATRKVVEPVKSEAASVKRKRSPQMFRQKDVKRAIEAHMKAGLSVARTMIDKTGNIIIITGKPEAIDLAPSDEPEAEAENEWDTPL